MPSENLSDGIFYQSSHIFYQGCKIYPKQQKPPCRHSRKSGNLERKISRNRFSRQVSVPTNLDSRLRGN
ncbi:TPA: hypothetical protein ACLAP5_001749, partial [Neisseria meningitidis]